MNNHDEFTLHEIGEYLAVDNLGGSTIYATKILSHEFNGKDCPICDNQLEEVAENTLLCRKCVVAFASKENTILVTSFKKPALILILGLIEQGAER